MRAPRSNITYEESLRRNKRFGHGGLLEGWNIGKVNIVRRRIGVEFWSRQGLDFDLRLFFGKTTATSRFRQGEFAVTLFIASLPSFQLAQGTLLELLIHTCHSLLQLGALDTLHYQGGEGLAALVLLSTVTLNFLLRRLFFARGRRILVLWMPATVLDLELLGALAVRLAIDI